MKLSSFFKKATACLLAVLMFATVIYVAPLQTLAFENDKVQASKTQIAAGSTVIFKKGAVRADNLKDISDFWNIFEFTVTAVENGVATCKYDLKGSLLQEYGITADKLITLIGLDPEKDKAAVMGIQIGMGVLTTFSFPVTYKVTLEDLTLVRDGILSTPEELKNIGREVSLLKDAVEADGKKINNVLSMLLYDITTVVDTVAHLQCRLTPGYLENMGITEQMIANLIGVDVNNEIFDLIYDAVTRVGYVINLDVDLKYVNFTKELPTDTDTESETDTEPKVKYGDVNSDKNIDLSDVVSMQRYIAKLSTFTLKQRQAGDVTGDSKVDLTDVVSVQRYIAKLITEFSIEKVDKIGR